MASPNRKQIPIALTIAGSDSGGGAGIQADLKTFAALGVHGTSVITCLTAQNPKKVLGVGAASAQFVQLQLEAVFNEVPPRAVKTGMLFSENIVRTTVEYLGLKRGMLVVDPVMISTSGAQLLTSTAVKALRGKLFPLASVITPNLDEAETLLSRKIRSIEAMRLAARDLHSESGCGVLMKGGHLRGEKEAIDIFYDGRMELLLQAPFVKGVSTHGTGCTYSAAITGYLALGHSLERAVALGKEFITQAIAQSRRAGSHDVLNSNWRISGTSR